MSYVDRSYNFVADNLCECSGCEVGMGGCEGGECSNDCMPKANPSKQHDVSSAGDLERYFVVSICVKVSAICNSRWSEA